ncbi:MAG: hypothetical protein J6I68_14675 [Butyrivibrio sp.]|uniref:hypothetical protein n=1 Tax=Butyrivibrio sp. TaxID=28121 RepID=UPI001B579621|nr:hypothetical protein [Butyrivibrio sp.]MBP3784487.1 hypothetical protein [Butyrivibrio sp.]
MTKGNGYNRKKENYYEMTLYFSSSKKEEVSLYFFLKQLTQRRKATAFITKLFSEYLKLCGYKDPTSIRYEDVEKLPSITELIEKNKQTGTDATGLLNMLSTLMANNTAAPVNTTVQTQKQEETPTKPIEENTVVTEPVRKDEAKDIVAEQGDETKENLSTENENIDSSWLTGLSSFMGDQ